MIIVLIILDQMTKLIANNVKPSFEILGDFFEIQYIQNTGTIFGLFENSNYIFMALAVFLCVAICIYMNKNVEKKSRKEKFFLLILAGGVGNLIDRIFRGYVVDFISIKWIGVFNFADVYVVVGVLLIILSEIKEWQLKKELPHRK